MPASFTLDHVGPMARTSEDCALLLDALIGVRRYAAEVHGGTAGLRIALADLDAEQHLDLAPDVAAALDRAARELSRTSTISRLRLPPLLRFSAVCTVLAGADAYSIHRQNIEATPQLFDPLTRQRILAGKLIAAADYKAADRVRDRLREIVAQAMSDVDLLLMPTTRDTAPLLGDFDSHGGHPSLGRPWNVTGFPALSVRCGFDRRGLPIGLQIVGHPGADALVLRAGHVIESFFDGRDVWPELTIAAPPPRAESRSSADESNSVPLSLVAVIASAVDELRRADAERPR